MDCIATNISYQQTGHFSKIIIDYLAQSPLLEQFYQHPVSLEGIRQSIEARKGFSTSKRKLLVAELEKQYGNTFTTENVKININNLLKDNTFTIVTAHQPNIFTGYLYFIYKILHTIRLADLFQKELPGYNFVPLFYMGSEDADLDELGKIFLNGEKITWDTKQQGAIGRMSTKGLEKIIARIEGELGIYDYGKELMAMLKECYPPDIDIQTATFRLINKLFAGYGLVVLLPDNAHLKKEMTAIFKDDLWHQTPSAIVEKTNEQLAKHYKVQANPRDINLFYLKDGIRERIVKTKNEWQVVGQDIHFSEKELEKELDEHPERFSPNVILRGLFQETILPNIAFIGGGGEMAYWLELRDLFTHYNVPFPVLVLRNSFLFVEKKWKEKMEKLGFDASDFFKEERLLLEELVKRDSLVKLNLNDEKAAANAFYEQLKKVSGKVDVSLEKHVEALSTKALRQLQKLEKKLIKAEKKKFEAQQRQLHTIKEALFPKGHLQERTDNFMLYYAKWGAAFIQAIYEHSPALEQQFVIVCQNDEVNLS